MSNLIKSFRIVEGVTPKEEEVKLDSDDNYIESSPGFDPELEILRDHIIDKAKEEAKLILDIANQRAESILKETSKDREALLKEASEDAEEEALRIKEEAKSIGYKEGLEKGHSEGYDRGFADGKEIADGIISEAIDLKNHYLKEKENLLKELEEDIISLVTDIVNKVIGQIDEGKDLIVDLVLNGIKNLDPTDNLIIVVSKNDYDTLLESKETILAHASLINELEIKYDINMEKGDCILETEKGNIDISLKDQLKEVEELLQNILNNE